MELMLSMIAFFALVVSWFVLPSSPPVAHQKASTAEPLPSAA